MEDRASGNHRPSAIPKRYNLVGKAVAVPTHSATSIFIRVGIEWWTAVMRHLTDFRIYGFLGEEKQRQIIIPAGPVHAGASFPLIL